MLLHLCVQTKGLRIQSVALCIIDWQVTPMTDNNNANDIYRVIQCFEKIQKTTKLKVKKELLKQYDCKLLRLCLYYCYNPFLQFNIKQIPEDEVILRRAKLDLQRFFHYLKSLAEKGSATKDDRIRLSLCMGKDRRVRHWLQKIVMKDLGIGININVINSVFDNLIPRFDVMLAQPQSYLERFLSMYPEHYVNYKLDGIRCLAMCTDKGVILYTRKGKRLTNFTHLEKVLKRETKDLVAKYGSIVLDGELTDRQWNNFQDLMTTVRRKYGQGAFNYDEVVFNVFDVFSYKSLGNLPLCRRVELLDNYFDNWPLLSEKKPETIVRVDYELNTDNSIEVIGKYLDNALQHGFEGLILKNPNTPYQFKRTIDWVKVKQFDYIDCLVIDVFEGKGKHKGMLGGVIVQLPNKKTCAVGSGFSDYERQYYWDNPNEIVGKYIEVKFQDYTKDGLLRFPVFVRVRDDK